MFQKNGTDRNRLISRSFFYTLRDLSDGLSYGL